MKIKGRRPGANVAILVLPRPDGDIVIKARAVEDYKKFDAAMPEPKPPVKVMRGGMKVPMPDSVEFLESLRQWSKKRMSYLILQSLKETEDLEWEKVKLDDPNTWDVWEQELLEAGFSEIELQRIIGCVTEANCLDDKKLDEARKRFLAGLEEEANQSSSLLTEQVSTASGEPVSVST